MSHGIARNAKLRGRTSNMPLLPRLLYETAMVHEAAKGT